MWFNAVKDTNVTIEHPEWGENVLRDTNGKIVPPMSKSQNIYLVRFDIFNCIIGVILNLYVFIVILFINKHLRKNPKYVLLLNAIVCNYLTLLTDAIEAAYHYWPSDELCESSVSTFYISTLSLLFTNTLSLANQLVTITKPQWHRDNVTPRLVVAGSLILYFLLSLFINWVYVFGVEPVRCAFQAFHVGTIAVTWFVLFISSAIIAIFIYLKTKPVSSEQDHDDAVSIDEKKWARKFMFSLIPIFLLPLVPTLTSLPCLVCLQFYPPDSVQCRFLFLVATYDNKISSLNAIISPLLIVWRDPELHSPFLNWLNRLNRSFIMRISNFLSTFV